ncbi:MAG TPA: helix-turn-helix domain-containing protein [Myxococcaceae bacterium]|nr:helix-turn-helix domain-containing protein [Myxococcaceae bacterium]
MKPFQDQTYYELLEVPVTASENEIRSAYERAAELYAPDSVAIYALESPAQAEELRARLREAMEFLTDPDLREEYDRSIGILRRAKPPVDRGELDVLPREPNVVAATEVLPTSQSLHSTHPEISVSYMPPPERSESLRGEPLPLRAEPPPPRNESDSSPVREAMPFAPPPEPRHLVEPIRAAVSVETVRPLPEPARPAPEPVRPSPESPRPAARPSRGMEATQLAEESAIATAESALAQVAAKVRGEAPPKPKSIDIPADAEFNGELLRRVRESRGLTLSQVSERTRISKVHLENIEADRYKDLPVAVYLRGFLMSISREYGLDALRVSKSYMALAGKKA